MPRITDIVQDRPLHSAETGETVADVARRMASWNIGALVVLDREGNLAGVFSERDLMKRVVLRGLDPESTPIHQVMSTDLTKADEFDTLDDAMELMKRCGCRHLPVMRSGRVIGFISMRDLMLYELERKTDEIEQMRAYIQSA